jgi:hypothetical protein
MAHFHHVALRSALRHINNVVFIDGHSSPVALAECPLLFVVFTHDHHLRMKLDRALATAELIDAGGIGGVGGVEAMGLVGGGCGVGA